MQDVSVAAFKQWLASAKPGDRFVYHRGLNLMHGPERDPRVRQPVQALAWRASFERKVFLLTERHARGDYSYLAVRASAKAPERIFPHDDCRPCDYGADMAA